MEEYKSWKWRHSVFLFVDFVKKEAITQKMTSLKEIWNMWSYFLVATISREFSWSQPVCGTKHTTYPKAFFLEEKDDIICTDILTLSGKMSRPHMMFHAIWKCFFNKYVPVLNFSSIGQSYSISITEKYSLWLEEGMPTLKGLFLAVS